MKEVSLPIVPHDQCQEALRRTRLGRRFRLHRSFVCAGGQEGKDSCKGDGGKLKFFKKIVHFIYNL